MAEAVSRLDEQMTSDPLRLDSGERAMQQLEVQAGMSSRGMDV